jgi:hypothetical protein
LSTPIGNEGLKISLANHPLGSSLKPTFKLTPNSRGTELKTKFLEYKHMPRLNFFNLGVLNSILKQMFLNM